MPRQLGKYMQSCWHQNPNRRPTFSSLVISLSQLKREYCETSELSSPTDSGILSMPRQQISKPCSSTSPSSPMSNPSSAIETREPSRSRPSSSSLITPTTENPQISNNSPGSRGLPRIKPVMTVTNEENDIQVEVSMEKTSSSSQTLVSNGGGLSSDVPGNSGGEKF